MKADTNFPICVGGCGRRGKSVVWYQISENVRFGECLYCHADRTARTEKIDAMTTGPVEWDPPEEDPTGPDDRPLPWKV